MGGSRRRAGGVPGSAELGKHIVESLIAEEFDVAQFSCKHDGRSLGHAFTFPRCRLMGGRVVPLVPVYVNTYYASNQPSPRRCFMFGRALNCITLAGVVEDLEMDPVDYITSCRSPAVLGVGIAFAGWI